MKMGQIGLNMFEHDGEDRQYQPRFDLIRQETCRYLSWDCLTVIGTPIPSNIRVKPTPPMGRKTPIFATTWLHHLQKIAHHNQVTTNHTPKTAHKKTDERQVP